MKVFKLAAGVAVVFLRQDETPEPAIALEVPAQIARPDPLRFEPGRTEDYERALARLAG